MSTQWAVAAGLPLQNMMIRHFIRPKVVQQSGHSMEKRKYTRISSSNLLSYACVNADNTVVQQGMGKTLDISEGGILLETHVPIEMECKVHLDIGFRDDVAKIIGKVAYTRKGQHGRTESGISFEEYSEKSHQVLQQFIESFNSKS